MSVWWCVDGYYLVLNGHDTVTINAPVLNKNRGPLSQYHIFDSIVFFFFFQVEPLKFYCKHHLTLQIVLLTLSLLVMLEYSRRIVLNILAADAMAHCVTGSPGRDRSLLSMKRISTTWATSMLRKIQTYWYVSKNKFDARVNFVIVL